jgi:c-di-GMP-binding flagellar brake protein YcgR
MPIQFELLQEEQFARYLLKEKADILYNLRNLIQRRAMLSAFLDEGPDSFLSAVLGITPDERHLILDAAGDARMNQRAEETERLICATQLDHIKVQFALKKLERISHDGLQALRSPLPQLLLRLQRREHYRLNAPPSHGLACLIPVQGKGHSTSLKADVLDISGGGLAFVVPPNAPPLEPDMQLSDCRVMLPDVGPISTALQVRNLRPLEQPGQRGLRAGCQFMALSNSMATTIQRYIFRVERERNKRERLG